MLISFDWSRSDKKQRYVATEYRSLSAFELCRLGSAAFLVLSGSELHTQIVFLPVETLSLLTLLLFVV